MKNEKLGFGEDTIETPSVYIRKNIMIWDNNMIQLSNISCISASGVNDLPFPVWAAIVMLVGLVMFAMSPFVAIVLIAVGGFFAFQWYSKNEKRKEEAILTIRMNSGSNFFFLFNDKNFLHKVLNVLENIIVNGNVSGSIEINIKDSNYCQFSHSERCGHSQLRRLNHGFQFQNDQRQHGQQPFCKRPQRLW